MVPRVRFAPSPTGLLHVGNLRIALANFLFARRHGGQFLLRLDDTDTARSRAEHAEGIEQDLRWAGLDWDGFFRQSDRIARYAAAADRLRAAGLLYPCFETEAELAAKREAARKRGQAPIYDRAMLSLTETQLHSALANGKTPYWRFRLSGTLRGWHDLVLGPRQVKLSAVSDPVLIRADGTFLYSFTSVVDDLDEAITHIVRGEDHVTNSGVQLDLMAALGAAPDRIALAHLPLLTEADGTKLSKRLDALSLRSLARDGIEPMALTAYLARLGTARDPAPLSLTALAADFDLATISRSSARFDIRQLLALNRRVLHEARFEAVADRLPPGADAIFWQAVRGNLDLLSEAGYWLDVTQGEIAPPALPEAAELLNAALALLPPEPWDGQSWKDWTAALREATGQSGRALFHPLRLALTGEEAGPDLATLLPLIGPARTKARLRAALG